MFDHFVGLALKRLIEGLIRFNLFLQISFFLFVDSLCWVRGLCISFTSSCFLFPVGRGGGCGKFETRGLDNFRTWGLPF